jgi:RNA polymerase sigma factor (sigma-70 family)
MPVKNFDGFEIKAAIASETVSDEVWNRLVEYAEPLLKTIRFTFGKYEAAFDEQDCRSILHDTIVKVVLNIDQYDPSRSFLSWARGIARNRTIDVLRDRTKQFNLSEALAPLPGQRTKESKAQGEHGEDAFNSAGNQDDLIEDETRSETGASYTYEYGEDVYLAGLPKTRIFQRELTQLSDEEQELIIDHWGNNIPLVDLARRADMQDAAMRKRAERVREKLYRRLIKHPEFSDLKLSRIKKSLPDT